MTAVTLRSSNRTPRALVGTPGTAVHRLDKAKRGSELLAQIVADTDDEIVEVGPLLTLGVPTKEFVQLKDLLLEMNSDTDTRSPSVLLGTRDAHDDMSRILDESPQGLNHAIDALTHLFGHEDLMATNDEIHVVPLPLLSLCTMHRSP